MIDLRVNVQASFNQDFCDILEYRISKALHPENKRQKFYWCDGIEVPLIDQQFSEETIRDITSVTTACWFGYDGQGRWLLQIKLGECAKATCLNGLNLEGCLPDLDSVDWIDIDDQELRIVIELK